MLKGKNNKVRWRNYLTDKFKFPKDTEDSQECGAWALHVLTRQPLKQIMKMSKNGHWSTKTMLGYLKKNGYEVIPVTMGNMVNAHDGTFKPKIGSDNIVLVCQRCFRWESTWAVIHQGRYSHSSETDYLSGLEFLNFPIDTAYIVWHNKWRSKTFS